MLGTAVSRSGDDPAAGPLPPTALANEVEPESRWRKSVSRRVSRAARTRQAPPASAVSRRGYSAGAGAGVLRRRAGACVPQRPARHPRHAAIDRKPVLALLTSLPLLFGEAFALDAEVARAGAARNALSRDARGGRRCSEPQGTAAPPHGAPARAARRSLGRARRLGAARRARRPARRSASSNGRASGRSAIGCGRHPISPTPACLAHWGLRLRPGGDGPRQATAEASPS